MVFYIFFYLEDMCVSVKMCVKSPAELRWVCVWDVSCAEVCSPPRLPSCARDPRRDNHPNAASDNGRFDWPRTQCSHYIKSVFIPLSEPSPSLPHPCFLSSNLIYLGVSSPFSFTLLESVIMNICPYMGGINFLIMSSKYNLCVFVCLDAHLFKVAYC